MTMQDRVPDAKTALRATATDHDMANLGRFGIDAPSALGVSMANLQKIAKRLGRDRDLAAAVWETGVRFTASRRNPSRPCRITPYPIVLCSNPPKETVDE